MNKPDAARAVSIDGTAYQRKQDGSLVPLVDRSDYRRLDAKGPAPVERAADPDGPPTGDEDWARGEVRRPVKMSVGLKLDDDVPGRFKAQGRGYQTRINAVPRRYVEARGKAG